MSDVKAVTYLLIHNAPLTGEVPIARIMPGVIPQGTPLPAVGITHISTLRRHAIAGTAKEFCTSRVQVTVKAGTYVKQKAIAKLIRAALPRTRGTVNNVDVDSIMHQLDGPDWVDDDASIFMQTLDYIVRFAE